jgi:retron-type reverse transcriptase
MPLIRKFLANGVMIGGAVMDAEEGAPQGGPISPPLSSIMPRGLGKEPEKRGLGFSRCAGGCNVCASPKGQRTM